MNVKIIAALLVILVIVVITYLIASWINLSFNPLIWCAITKTVYSIFNLWIIFRVITT